MAKLSKEAAKRKAVRDKKAAMTPARRKKKQIISVKDVLLLRSMAYLG